MKFSFLLERNPNLSAKKKKSGIFIFLPFTLKNLWCYIAISQQSDFLCKSFERWVFILKRVFNSIYSYIYEISNDYKLNAKAVYDASFLLIGFLLL